MPTPSNHPVDVGQRSEAAILAAFMDRGFEVLLPWGTNHRYDMVLDLGDRFLRVQCKTGRLRNGAVDFVTQSVRSNTKRCLRRSYHGEVDYFAVYCPENRAAYVVPCSDVTPGQVTLRITAPANGQRRRIRWAADFEIARFRP